MAAEEAAGAHLAAHWSGGAQNGYTALICAAMNGHVDCARLLLDAGADKNAKNNVRASAVGGVRGIVELRWSWSVACSDVFTVLCETVTFLVDILFLKMPHTYFCFHCFLISIIFNF